MTILRAHEVSKRYRRLASGRTRTLRSLVEGAVSNDYWAVRDVSFEIDRGEGVGIIGANGSGKSTLLRILAGITRQTSGTVEIDGDIGTLLGLGGGFHPMLTGVENAVTASILTGLTRKEAIERLPQIASFAELDDEIHQPLRMLSAGQQMRLAFAVAINIDPDLLLIDEVLAVGDLRFQEKCFERLEKLRTDGVAIALVSHDMGQIRRLCDRAVWLEGGKVRYGGPASEVCHHFEREMHGEPAVVEVEGGGWRIGTGQVRIDDVRMLGGEGQDLTRLARGEPLQVAIRIHSEQAVSELIVSVGLHRRDDGMTVLNVNTETDGVVVAPLSPGTAEIRLSIDRIDLGPGAYLLDVGAYSPDWAKTYDYLWGAMPLEITGGGPAAVLSPPRTWEIRR